MKNIYKYILKATDIQIIEMPKDSEILTVQVQNGVPCLWVKVSECSWFDNESVTIHTCGTGNPMGEVGPYIGTYQLDGGSLVFHVFIGESSK
jgi:hypothetical protein